MRKKISIFILNNSGAPIRQVTTSKTALVLLTLLLFVGFSGVGYLGYRHHRLMQALKNKRKAEEQAACQLIEIKNQRKQIQAFAEKIDALKTRLSELNDFEKKIRIIANLENAEEQGGLFGIGGSKPEDLSIGIELDKKQAGLIREMHDQIDQIETAISRQDEGFETLLKGIEKQQNLLASTPAIHPVDGWITSGFGYRVSPFTNKKEFHKGIDIAAAKGTPVVATAAGTITSTGNKGTLGRVLTIDHGHGMVTRFAHLAKFLKSPGEKVKRGDTIALVGNSGRSTGPHVHYEVHLNGIPVNPKKYLLD
jgi:murein DD-endopeptidase MepM/ murein hydrolase activator NlpD